MTNDRGSQSITVSAKTVADAIAEAQQRLGLSSDEIDVTVISEGSKGFLGMGSENARILAMPKTILARRTPEAPPTVTQAPARPATSAPGASPSVHPTFAIPPVDGYALDAEQSPLISRARKQAAAAGKPAPETTLELPTPPATEEYVVQESAEPQAKAVAEADVSAVAEVAVEIVRGLLSRMGLDATATVRGLSNPVIIDIAGEDLGLLIGRHGDTLSSLQYLVNTIVGRRVNRWCRVIVDVEHYRVRREETLRAVANRHASRVRQTRQDLTLEPMPANERRIVHMTLQSSPWVITHSVGEEPNRCVVIAPRPGAR